MKRNIILLAILITNILNAQSYKYAHYCLDSLTSKNFSGRAYQNLGDKKAKNFIKNELIKNNISDIKEQEFDISINNIKDVKLKLYSKDSAYLKAGEDYMVYGYSPSTNLIITKEKPIRLKNIFSKRLDYKNYNNKVILLDYKTDEKTKIYSFLGKLNRFGISPKLVIIQNGGKMQYPMGTRKNPFPVIELKDEINKKKIDYLELSIVSEYNEKYTTQNLWAKIEGTQKKDSFFVFISHYDHLGMINDSCYFPGANDNASGVSVSMDLAKYYSNNPSPYSIVFIFSSAEEIGLIGSNFAAENPFIDLSKVKFLFNLDMCGTGSQGIALINGEKEKRASDLMKEINDEELYFNEIRIGGESCNSDHCPFVEKDVPSLFLFTFGCEYNEYHTIYDNGKGLSFTKHLDFCNILKEFIKRY
ncbi:MAG: M28 family peptidase [Bacteroidales bacterium]|jgi:hypothetical protein|nr:M28 family peptidase [Bacteroidales bacterium]